MSEADGAQRAAAFFRQRGLQRVIAQVRERFWKNDGPIGRIEIADATAAEHAGLASLSGTSLSSGPLRVNLAALDRVLQASGFACSLEEALAAYFGTPVGGRRADLARQHREDEHRQASWAQVIDGIAASLPANSLGQRWLTDGVHGRALLARQHWSLPPDQLAGKQEAICTVCRALSSLPLPAPRRLAQLANDLAGDPHALDPQGETGRLFAQALLDLFGADLEIGALAADQLSAGERRQLYEHAQILSEAISSTVAVYNLARATGPAGCPDPSVASSHQSLQILPLRRLQAWQSAEPASRAVYILENPVVFEDLLDHLEGRGPADDRTPTVICTAGWPSVAALRLLDLLQASPSRPEFHYSGDFDLAGLRMAVSLQERYPARCQPWRMTAADYDQAVRRDGKEASPDQLRQLATFEPRFPDLVPAMLRRRRWAYQEAIVALLLEDVSGE